MITEVLNFELENGIGLFDISYDAVDAQGSVSITARYNGIDHTIPPLVEGNSGIITIQKDELFVNDLEVIISSQIESSVSIVVGSLQKNPLDVRIIAITSEIDVNRTTHIGYRYNEGDYVSAMESKLIQFTNGTEVLHPSVDEVFSGFEGDPMFPISGSKITMTIEQMQSDTYKFNPTSLYAFYVLRTNTDYGNDIKSIMQEATPTAPIQSTVNENMFYGQLDMPASGSILYILFDLRSRVLIGGKITSDIIQSCCEPFGFSSVGIDALQLKDAAHAFNDIKFINPIADAYFSTGYNDPNSVVVKTENSRIVSVQPCPDCVNDCEDIVAEISTVSPGVHNIDILLSPNTGAMVMSFDFGTAPNGVLVEYDGKIYNRLISTPDGDVFASSVKDAPVYVGDPFDPCSDYVLTYPTMTLDTLDYYNDTFTLVGQEEVSISAGQVHIFDTGSIYPLTMVIPKTSNSPQTMRVKIISPCAVNGFSFGISCPSLLPVVTIGNTSSLCGSAAYNKIGYILKRNGNISPYPELGDIMYADPYGALTLPQVHGDGYYRAAEIYPGDMDRSFAIDGSGVVIDEANCGDVSGALKSFICSRLKSDQPYDSCSLDLSGIAYSSAGTVTIGHTLYANAAGTQTFFAAYGSGYFRTVSGSMYVNSSSVIDYADTDCPDVLIPFQSSEIKLMMLEACQTNFSRYLYSSTGGTGIGEKIYIDPYAITTLFDSDGAIGYFKDINGGWFTIDSNSTVTAKGECVIHKSFNAIKLAVGQDCWDATENITLYFSPSSPGSIPAMGEKVYTDILGISTATAGSYKSGHFVLTINSSGVVTASSECVPPSILEVIQISSTTGTMFSVCGLSVYQDAYVVSEPLKLGDVIFADAYGNTRISNLTGAGYYKTLTGWVKINSLSVVIKTGTACPSALNSFQSSAKKNSALFACDAALDKTYYSDNGAVIVGKKIYVDAYMTSTLAQSVGYVGYFKSPLSGWFKINSDSIVTEVGNCIIPQ